MSLEESELIGKLIDDLIVVLAGFAGLIGTFYNQRMVNDRLRQRRVLIPSKYVLKRFLLWLQMHTWQWWGFVVCSSLVIVLTFYKNSIDSNIDNIKDILAKQKDSTNLAKYQAGIEQLSVKNSLENEQLAIDNRKEKDELKQQADMHLKDITGNMAAKFALANYQQVVRDKAMSEKLEKNKLKPAIIISLPEPDNVFSVSYKSNTLFASYTVVNDGDYPAYKVGGRFNVLARIENVLYNLTPGGIKVEGRIIGSQIKRTFEIPIKLDSSTYTSITETIILADLQWYNDVELKEIKTSKINFANIPGETGTRYYDRSIEDILSDAKNINN